MNQKIIRWAAVIFLFFSSVSVRAERVIKVYGTYGGTSVRLANEEIIGIVSLVYDHRTHRLGDLLADMQHKAKVVINASLHIHLDEHNCLEVIVIRGIVEKVHEVAGKLIATKGVQNGKLVTTTAAIKG